VQRAPDAVRNEVRDQAAGGIAVAMNEKQQALCKGHSFDFSGLSAIFLNCTLKPTGVFSHTEALIGVSRAIMDANGIGTEVIRPVDYVLPPGVYPDMTEHGFDRDDWPELCGKVLDADILVMGTPIWLGEESSVCRRTIERLYGESGKLNDKGQYLYYGRVGGCIVTGNEDGVKHCAMTVCYALQHLGYVIPPQADAGWIGEAGPGPSYADDGSGGPENDFTQRNVTFMTWNLMHMARLLKDAGGIPAHGNQRSEWEAGCRFDHPNPDYR
jgi:multimeric flavodoxin WrbA